MSARGAGGRGFESHWPHSLFGFMTKICQQSPPNIAPFEVLLASLNIDRATGYKIGGNCEKMPAKLATTVPKIATVPNKVNAALLTEFHRSLKEKGSSEAH